MKILTTLSLALMFIGCSKFPNYQAPFSVKNPLLNESIKTNDTSKEITYLEKKAQSFIKAYEIAKTKKNDNAAITNYIDSGITYSLLLCNDYFDKLTLTKAHREFAKKETNLVSGLASGLMGLANTSSAVIAGSGVLFSFSQSSFDAYNESYMLSPNLSMLERLVKERQIEEEIVIYKKLNASYGETWPNKIETLEQGERVLSGYISHCTVNGIKNLIDTSVQNKTKAIINNSKKIQRNKNISAFDNNTTL